MVIKKISFPTQTALSEIKHIDDANIDVFVELEDGNSCTVVVMTPKNILSLMEQNKRCFHEPGCPEIIVRELTEECIYTAIQAFCDEDAYWLKEYHLSGRFDIALLNKMLKRDKERV